MQHREEDFIKRELISLGFFIGMITDTDPIGAHCLDYIVNVDVRLSLSILKPLRPNALGELRPTGENVRNSPKSLRCGPSAPVRGSSKPLTRQ